MSAIHILGAHRESYRERRICRRWGDISRHYIAGNGSSGTDFLARRSPLYHLAVIVWLMNFFSITQRNNFDSIVNLNRNNLALKKGFMKSPITK